MAETIYHLSGFRVVNEDNGPSTFYDTAWLQIAFTNSVTSFSYSITGTLPDEAFPQIEIDTAINNTVLNFSGIDDPNNLPNGADAIRFELGYVDWSGGRTILLRVTLDQFNTYVDESYFVLDGPQLPINSIADFETFSSTGVQGAGEATGDFAPGEEISLTDIPNVIVGAFTEGQLIEGDENDNALNGVDGDDTLIGNGGNDDLFGSLGNDSLLGGAGDDTLTGYLGNDTLDGGDGTDLLIMNLTGIYDSTTYQAIISFGSGQTAIYNPGDTSFVIDYTTGELTTVGDAIELDQISNFEGVGLLSDILVTVLGGAADDDLRGSDFDDTMAGAAGNDTLDGSFGADSILGGAGADSLLGQNGHDILSGNDGNDTINGGWGHDTAFGGADDDFITMDIGRDLVGAGDGNDTVDGGDGNDSLFGAAGNDSVDGGIGDDLIGLAAGDDTGNGGAGADEIWTSLGNDFARGDEGNDTLGGSGGNDTLFGDEGDDELWGSDGNDSLNGGAGNDTLGGSVGDDGLNGDEGNDELWGSFGNDMLSGGEGQDSLGGGDGRDFIMGDEGNDELYGGLERDTLAGGDGDDTLYGGAGDDLLDGYDGDDLIFTGSGEDTVELRLEGGQDTVQGLSLGEDVVRLSAQLWETVFNDPDLSRTEQEVLDDFGAVVGDDFVLTFDGGQAMTLAGFGTATDAELRTLIEIS